MCIRDSFRLKLHLAPPLFSHRDSHTGEPIKFAFGSWIFPVLKILSRFKFLRGTDFDLFGKTKERRMERQLIKEYEQTIEELLCGLTKKNHNIALEIAKIPQQIRGYDLVKKRHFETSKSIEKKLLSQFRDSVKITVGLTSSETVG